MIILRETLYVNIRNFSYESAVSIEKCLQQHIVIFVSEKITV